MSVPTLQPGSGWSGATSQPASTGARPAAITSVNTSANTLTIDGDFSSLDAISAIGFASTDTLPGGLEAKVYWCAIVGTSLTVYPSRDDAVAGENEIDLTDSGTGTHTATPWGSEENAIAQWDVVPYQLFDGVLRIGVIAFHANGIDRVEFSAEDGTWASVSEPTLNPDTGIVEYCVDVDAEDFSDGRIEIRAVAYPTNGVPRVLQGPVHNLGVSDGVNMLHSLYLHANHGGTIAELERYVSFNSGDDDTGDGSSGNPFKTIHAAAASIEWNQGGDAGGGRILLQAGDHPWTGFAAGGGEGNPARITSDNTWMIVTRDPSASRESVQIATGGAGDAQGLRAHLVAVHGVTVRGSVSTAALSSNNENPAIWFDDCHFTADDPVDENDTSWAGPTLWVGGVWCTNSSATRVRNFARVRWWCRNCHASEVGADVFRAPRAVIGCSAEKVGGYPIPEHADICQWSGTGYQNDIIYGLTATVDIESQTIFSRRSTGGGSDGSVRDIALIDIHVAPQFNVSQWQQDTRHLVIRGMTHENTGFLFRNDSDDEAEDPWLSEFRVLSVEDSTFHQVSNESETPDDQFGIGFKNNIFASGTDWDASPSVDDEGSSDPPVAGKVLVLVTSGTNKLLVLRAGE